MELETILMIATEQGASDVHLTAGSPPTLRVYGDLLDIEIDAMGETEVQELIYDLLREDQIEKLEKEKDLDLSLSYAGHRMRANVYWHQGTLGIALRLISFDIPSSSQLNLPEILLEWVNAPQGLVLVTGATGQGKSTTMASMINEVNEQFRKRIITIEDPVEYVYKNQRSVVIQREVGHDTHTFHHALRQALRQDPDVILIGEIRDYETVQAVLSAAETGHLIISTLHTNDTSQAIDRIIDMCPQEKQGQIRSQLSLSLVGITAQRLVKTVTGNLSLASEVLCNTSAIGNLIREGKTHQIYSAIELGNKHGMITMNQALKKLAKKGVVAHEEVVKYYSFHES